MAILSGYDGYNQSYSKTPSQGNVPTVPTVKPHSGNASKPPETVVQPQPTQPQPQPQSTHDEPSREASSATNDDTLQDGVIHETSGKYSVNEKKVPTVKKKITKATIQIRDFRRDVMDIVRGVVPGGNSYVETLLAYIYVTSPTKFDIPPNVQAIVNDYVQEDPLTQVFKEIRLLREQMKNVEMTTYQSALASEYGLFTALGFRKDTADNPIDVNYLESGVEDMHISLEEGAKQLKKKDTVRHGRR